MSSLLRGSLQLHKSRLHCVLPLLFFFMNAWKRCKHSKWNIWGFSLNVCLTEVEYIFPVLRSCSSFVCLWQPDVKVTQPELWWRELGFPVLPMLVLLRSFKEDYAFISPFSYVPFYAENVRAHPSLGHRGFTLRALGSALDAWLAAAILFHCTASNYSRGRKRSQLFSPLGYSYSRFWILSFFFSFQLFSPMLIQIFIPVCLDPNYYDITDHLHSTSLFWLWKQLLWWVLVLWTKDWVAGLKRCSWKTQWHWCSGQTHMHPLKWRSFVPTVLLYLITELTNSDVSQLG